MRMLAVRFVQFTVRMLTPLAALQAPADLENFLARFLERYPRLASALCWWMDRCADDHRLAVSLPFAVFMFPTTLMLRILLGDLNQATIAPGWRLLRLLQWLYSAKTVNRVFKPAILDMQYEHIEALAEGRPLKARWVLARGYFAVWSAVVAQTPISLMKQLYELLKAAS